VSELLNINVSLTSSLYFVLVGLQLLTSVTCINLIVLSAAILVPLRGTRNYIASLNKALTMNSNISPNNAGMKIVQT